MQKLFLFLSILVSVNLLGQLSVITVSPSAQSISNLSNTSIVVDFSQDLFVQNISGEDFHVFGRWSGPMSGSTEIDGSQLIFTPAQNFFHGEWITVTLSKNIESASGETLEYGYQWNFWIKVNSASFELSNPQIIEMREEGEGQIQSYGAYAGDLNDDNTSDLVVINEISNDVRILMNDAQNGYSDFEIMPLNNANKPSTNEGADFDMDGFIDLAIGNTQNATVNILFGDGTDFDSQITLNADQGIRGLALLDFNSDGWTDIVTANRAASNLTFFENNTNGGFEDAVLQDIPNCNGETALMAADFNGDGLLDLALGCFSSSNIIVLLNDGNGNFQIADQENANSNPWMVGVGDFNNDGMADITSANSGSSNISIYFGEGNGQISSPEYFAAGGFPLAIDVGDLDGDQDLDIACSNYFSDDFTIMQNESAAFNATYSLPAQSAGSCAIFHDHNNDGLMDLTCVDEVADLLFIYTNESPSYLHEHEQEFKVYPNPTSDFVKIEGQFETYDLLNTEGKVLQSLSSQKQEYIGDYPSGLYFLRNSKGISVPIEIIE